MGSSRRPLAKLQDMLEGLFKVLAKGATVQHVHRSELQPSELDELWSCYSHFVDRPRDDFERALAHASDVNLYRHPSGELIGFEAYRFLRLRVRGRTCVVAYMVFMDLEPRARGHNFLQMTMLGRLLLLLSYYPFRSLFLVGTSASYKSYLLLSHNLAEFWPRRERATPAFYEELLDAVMTELGMEGWDAERGILRGGGRLRYREGIVAEERPRDPDAIYYAERNPGQAAGDALACVVPVSARNLVALSATTSKRWASFIRQQRTRSRGSS